MKRNAQGCSWQVWKRISVLLAGLLSVQFLTACVTTGTAPTPVPKVQAPEQCLLLAEPLPVLTDATLAGAVRNHAEVAAIYWQLAERHRCLAEFERGR